MQTSPLTEVLHMELKDLHSAEHQLLEALPKMAKNAATPSLREAFENHLDETKIQAERLEKIREILDCALGGEKCQGMEGLLKEGDHALKEMEESPVRDLVMIGAAQRVEHYEIAAYGTARALAEQIGESEVADLLSQTLEEESDADETLTEIAEEIMSALEE